MFVKMKEWLHDKGRRLAELKVIGNIEVFDDPISKDLTKLTNDEWIEFLVLTGQLDGLIWAFCPEDPDEALEFLNTINNIMCSFEEEFEEIQRITGMREAIKGFA